MHPVIISKNTGFRALYLARRNEFRFSFNKYNLIFFIFWLLAFAGKHLAFARKIMALPELGGCSPLARTPIYDVGLDTVS